MKTRFPRKLKKQFKAVQPIILVFYIDVGNLPDCDVREYLSKISEALTEKNSKTEYKYFFIPVRGQVSKVECINPVRTSGKVYENIVQKLNNSQQALDEFLSKKDESKLE